MKNSESVENEEEEIEQTNKERGSGELNEKIRLEEVRKIIGRLKNGKAAGVDGIVNEIIKHGGGTSTRSNVAADRHMFRRREYP